MKTKFLLVAILALFLSHEASAQVAGRYLMIEGGTNNVAASATNSYSTTPTYNPFFLGGVAPGYHAFMCPDFDDVAVSASFSATGPATGNVVFRYAKSYDGQYFEAVPSLSLVVPLNGTNSTANGTAFDLKGVYAIALVSIENTNSVAVTNIMAIINFKSPKYGKVQATM